MPENSEIDPKQLESYLGELAGLLGSYYDRTKSIQLINALAGAKEVEGLIKELEVDLQYTVDSENADLTERTQQHFLDTQLRIRIK